jgi:hypothetical protein
MLLCYFVRGRSEPALSLSAAAYRATGEQTLAAGGRRPTIGFKHVDRTHGETVMAEDETKTGGQGPPPKQPYGPGLLMVFGLVLAGLAVWCAYDLFVAQKGEGDTAFQAFNYGGMIVGGVAGIYCFILAAVRSKKGMPTPVAPAAPPSAESEPSESPADEAASEPPESDD